MISQNFQFLKFPKLANWLKFTESIRIYEYTSIELFFYKFKMFSVREKRLSILKGDFFGHFLELWDLQYA